MNDDDSALVLEDDPKVANCKFIGLDLNEGILICVAVNCEGEHPTLALSFEDAALKLETFLVKLDACPDLDRLSKDSAVTLGALLEFLKDGEQRTVDIKNSILSCVLAQLVEVEISVNTKGEVHILLRLADFIARGVMSPQVAVDYFKFGAYEDANAQWN